MSYPPQQPGPQDPWGQQPSQQGQYGAQDQSQDFWRQVAAGQQGPGHQGPGQQAGPPPPPLPKKSRAGVIAAVAAVAIVVVVGGGVVGLLAFAVPPSPTSSPTPTSRSVTPSASESAGVIDVGSCVDVESEYGGAMTDVACGSAESDYEVVDVHSGESPSLCPSNYGNTWEGSTYCMVLDVEVGDCLTSYREEQAAWPLKADCATPGVEDQVTKVVDVDDHTGVCTEQEGWYSFGDPKRTVCFGDVKGA